MDPRAETAPRSLRRTALEMAFLVALSLGLTVPALAQSQGVWEPPFQWPMVAVHLLHHTSGDILSWAYDGPSAHLWDPGTGIFTPVSNNNTNIFCSCHAAMKEGLYMVAGGAFVNSAQVFDNLSIDPGIWLTKQDMNFTRFYPTCTTLGDGRILTVSGYSGPGSPVLIPEIYTPSTDTWTQLPNAAFSLPLYPFMFLLPKGLVFFSGPGTATYALDVGMQTWRFVANSLNDGASAAMLTPGRIMKCGGSGTPTKITEVIDFNTNTPPAWVRVGDMAFARHDHNLTLLPDGTVLATGGHDEGENPVFAAELFNPQNGQWTTLASMQTPRLYHSTAQLLQDGRVLVAGGDGHTSGEIFNPPYLFQGSQPTITSAPDVVFVDQEFEVQTPQATDITAVNLLRLGAVTHSFDHNQRFVPLKFKVDASVNPPFLVVSGPLSQNVVPPGAYLLFLISSPGVPSVGRHLLVDCQVANLELANQSISSTQTFVACDTIFAGPNLTIEPTGNVTLHAGNRVVLRSGFRVRSGAIFRAVVP